LSAAPCRALALSAACLRASNGFAAKLRFNLRLKKPNQKQTAKQKQR
jgi:hypothetical protein